MEQNEQRNTVMSLLENTVNLAIGFTVPLVAYGVGFEVTKSEIYASFIMGLSASTIYHKDTEKKFRRIGYLAGCCIGFSAGIGGCVHSVMASK